MIHNINNKRKLYKNKIQNYQKNLNQIGGLGNYPNDYPTKLFNTKTFHELEPIKRVLNMNLEVLKKYFKDPKDDIKTKKNLLISGDNLRGRFPIYKNEYIVNTLLKTCKDCYNEETGFNHCYTIDIKDGDKINEIQNKCNSIYLRDFSKVFERGEKFEKGFITPLLKIKNDIPPTNLIIYVIIRLYPHHNYFILNDKIIDNNDDLSSAVEIKSGEEIINHWVKQTREIKNIELILTNIDKKCNEICVTSELGIILSDICSKEKDKYSDIFVDIIMDLIYQFNRGNTISHFRLIYIITDKLGRYESFQKDISNIINNIVCKLINEYKILILNESRDGLTANYIMAI